MNKLFFLTSLVLVLGLSALSFAQTQIQSGTWGADVNSKDYTLATNEGDRTIFVEVNFAEPFDVKPEVVLSVSHLDANKEQNMRYSISVMSVSRDAMTVKVRTWDKTQIFGIGGYWMAHSEKKMNKGME